MVERKDDWITAVEAACRSHLDAVRKILYLHIAIARCRDLAP
jgi:hypothetical protein